MKLIQVSYFLRLCDTLNFTRAAELCCVSQPSLSAAIHKLEEELGGLLFVRGGKQVVLTPLGEAMRVHLRRIEEAKNAATAAASSIVLGKPEPLNIGVMCSLNPDRLLPIYQKLDPKFSGTELLIHDVWEGKASELLLAGGLDCIFMANTAHLDGRFNVSKIATESIVIAMSKNHPLAECESVELNELQGELYIDRLRCEFREKFFDDLSKHNVQVQVVMRAEREDFVVAALAKGLGISMMPKMSAELAGLSTCELSNQNLERDICIVTVNGRPKPPLVEELVSRVQSTYG